MPGSLSRGHPPIWVVASPPWPWAASSRAATGGRLCCGTGHTRGPGGPDGGDRPLTRLGAGQELRSGGRHHPGHAGGTGRPSSFHRVPVWAGHTLAVPWRSRRIRRNAVGASPGHVHRRRRGLGPASLRRSPVVHLDGQGGPPAGVGPRHHQRLSTQAASRLPGVATIPQPSGCRCSPWADP